MTKDDITRMAREAGYGWSLADMHIAALERFANMVAADEREECAKAVERSYLSLDGSHGVGDNDWHIAERVTAHCAAAIRAREER